MSGKWKKIIWLICMLELCIIHGTWLSYLIIYHRIKIVIVFVIGTLGMIIFQYINYRHFIKDCVQDITMLEDESVHKVFCEANEQVGNVQTIQNRIYVNPHIRIPFVMGFVTPSVIIPTSCITEPTLFFAFLHECYHIKRYDTLYKYIMLACNCFLWFHPLAYFLRYISYRDIEISCDEAVVKGRTKEERYRYGKFLLESAGKGREKGKAYSAYWNDSKVILKHRIQAVMEEKRDWDLLARIAIVLLIIEVLGLAVWAAKTIRMEYYEANKPVNEFEGIEAPPMYTDEAIQKMMEVQPASSDTYGVDTFAQYDALYPKKEIKDIYFETENPWQFAIERPAHYRDAMQEGVQRFWYYMENQEAFSCDFYEKNPMNSTYETVYSELLAGDMENAVWGIIWKTYVTDCSNLNSYQNGYARLQGTDTNYVYFTMTVHVTMVEPYIFRIEGFADLEETLEAYRYNYPEWDFSTVPSLEERYVEIGTNKIDISAEEWSLPEDIIEKYPYGLSNVYIDFLEDNQTGYLLGAMERVVFQEACVLFKTTDGGITWEEIVMSENAARHSYTVDFDFLTEQHGYLAIHTSYGSIPQLLRTEDGGKNWEAVQFDTIPNYFCQPYVPELRDGKMMLFVGMEEYGKMEGKKAYYESTDEGRSWNYKKQVIRQ